MTQTLPDRDRHYRNCAILVMALAAAYHLAIIGSIGLGDNEAYYWTWSKHLDLSFYDHPAMVAYLIKLGTTLFGDNPFGVRITTTVLFFLTTLFVYLLTVGIFKSRRAGFYAVVLTNIVPYHFIVGLTIVPDAPLATLWVIFLFVLYRTVRGASWWHWYLLGAIAGVAFLSKYFAILLLPSALIFLASDPSLRRYLKTPHPYLGAILSFLIMSPVFWWNAAHGWQSFEFHLVARHSQGFQLENVGKMVIGQVSMLQILIFFFFAALWISIKRGFLEGSDIRYKFIVCTSAPTLLFFYISMSFADKAEAHWPALGYVPLMIAAAGLYPEYLEKWGTKKLSDYGWIQALGFGPVGRWMGRTSAFKSLVALGIALPLFLIVFTNVHLFYPLYRPEKSVNDVTNDLFGWDSAAERVRVIMGEMERETGRRPFIFSYHYNPASQISWALRDWENIYCLSGKTDQFDFWKSPDTLIGRDGIYVISERYDDTPEGLYNFDRIEGPVKIPVFRAEGYKAREFSIYKCYGYRGMKER
jgi:hypothetical protein